MEESKKRFWNLKTNIEMRWTMQAHWPRKNDKYIPKKLKSEKEIEEQRRQAANEGKQRWKIFR